jgi:prolyl-tRNA editing enzyme YbaK/EbsC (Cys-tRNA(Pro) deacylase)
MSVLDRIQALLGEKQAAFALSSHRPVYTSEEAAQVRGEDLKTGAKALIVRAKDAFVMFVLPGDRRLDSKRIKAHLGCKSLRFATAEEVEGLTGLRAGSIPPFGSLFGIATYCDRALSENERINFNAGSHTESINLRYEDYIRVERPVLADFSEDKLEPVQRAVPLRTRYPSLCCAL